MAADDPMVAKLMAGAKPVCDFRWPDCEPIDFFGAFFSDSSKFQQKTHEARGDKNCSCETWAPNGAMGFHSRVRKFRTGYKTPLGEVGACEMTETQRIKVMPAAATVLMVNTMDLAGIPYSDYYEVHTQFIVTTADGGIEVRVFQAITWLKSTWLKGKIGGLAYERCVDSFKVWPQNSLPTLRAYVEASRKPPVEGSEPQLVPPLAVLLATGEGGSPPPRQHPGRRIPSPPAQEPAGSASQLDAPAAAEATPSPPGEEQQQQPGGEAAAEGAEPFAAAVDAAQTVSVPMQRGGNGRWSLGAGDDAWWSAPSPRARRGDRDVVRITVAGDSVDCCAGLVRQFANASLPRDEEAAGAGASQFDATDPFAWAETAAEWWENGSGIAEVLPLGSSAGSMTDESESTALPGPFEVTEEEAARDDMGLVGLDGSCVREVSLHAQSANVLLSIWDTSRPANEQCSCDAAVVLYDVTSRSSFHHAEDWARRIRQDNSGDEGPIISLVGTHADVAISDDETLAHLLGTLKPPTPEPEPEPELANGFGKGQVIPLRLEPEVVEEFFQSPPDSPAQAELLAEAAGLDTDSDEDDFHDALEHDGDPHHNHHSNGQHRDSESTASTVPASKIEALKSRPRRVVTLEEGEMLAGRIAARSHFELPALVGTRLSPLVPLPSRGDGSSGACGHPVTQVVYSLLSDLLLGEGWHPDLLATRQRLAWAVVALPHQLPPRLPLTTVMHVANLLGRCAPRPVLSRERLAEAELWHRQGHYEKALEGYAHVLVAAGKDEAVEAAMRRAEAARWRQSHDEAMLGGDNMLGGMSPPSSSIAAAAADVAAGWWLWVDDSYSSECFRCRLPFTFFRRRHHCRHCGHLFCGSCSDKLAAGLWRVPPSPQPSVPPQPSGETAAGAHATDLGSSQMVMGFVGSKSAAEIDRLDRGVRESSLERVCRGCWKVLRNAEKRAQAARPNASIQQVQEAALRRRAATSAAEFFTAAGQAGVSSLALVQYLHAHASKEFCASRGLKLTSAGGGVGTGRLLLTTALLGSGSGSGDSSAMDTHELRAIASVRTKAEWFAVVQDHADALEVEGREAAAAAAVASPTGTPRAMTVRPDAAS